MQDEKSKNQIKMLAHQSVQLRSKKSADRGRRKQTCSCRLINMKPVKQVYTEKIKIKLAGAYYETGIQTNNEYGET